jgi:signal recognition particle receptor subunit beta
VPTVGLNVEQVKFRNNITLTLWDVGGNARKLWKHYYDKIDSLVFVVDCSDDKRLELAKSEMLKVISDPELDACPMLIFANKQDMDGSISG